LTTGQDWIFGLIEGQISDQATKKCFTLEQLEVDFNSSVEAIQAQLKMVFLTMLYWVRILRHSMSIRESELTSVSQSF
jgi:hypothetical protein